jgi:hypothetical protein
MIICVSFSIVGDASSNDLSTEMSEANTHVCMIIVCHLARTKAPAALIVTVPLAVMSFIALACMDTEKHS